jgi:PTH2 family peptidyl-tRNA hydrolase
MEKLKQVILVRTDLEMGRGKLATQVAHASVGAMRMIDEEIVKKWEKFAKKIVLKVKDGEELMKFYRKVKKEGMPCFLVKDAGLTQLEPGTVTALGIGPVEEEKIDKITGKLKLL